MTTLQNEKPKYYKPSMAEYMQTYRNKMTEEQRDKIREYQKMLMQKKRERERAEKLAQGIVPKKGRPKKRADMTPAEMKARIADLEKQLEQSIHNPPLS
jgi:hypothetical protein